MSADPPRTERLPLVSILYTTKTGVKTRLLSIEIAGSVKIVGVQQVQVVAHPLVEVIGLVFIDDIGLDHQDEFTARVLLS